MNKERFIKTQKILRLATVGPHGTPHIVPVWYRKIGTKFYIGTNTGTVKARNVRGNRKVSFCIDVGINSPDIFGVMGIGTAKLLLDEKKVKEIAKKILLRYYKTLKNRSAQALLHDTDCVIEITPRKVITWKF